MTHSALTSVLKIGGACLESSSNLTQLCSVLTRCHSNQERVVVVHGGGPEIGALHQKLDVPFVKHLGLRVTSEESMPLVTMVLCGLVNKRIVAALVEGGLPAIGISGIDLGLLRSRFINHPLLGRVGGPPEVSLPVLQSMLDQNVVPIVAPVSLGPDGQALNVNADTAAHAIATALKATTLDFVSDVPGVRITEDSYAPQLTAPQVEKLLAGSSVVAGGMIPKLQAALAALDAGVGCVRVGDINGIRDNTATEITAQ